LAKWNFAFFTRRSSKDSVLGRDLEAILVDAVFISWRWIFKTLYSFVVAPLIAGQSNVRVDQPVPGTLAIEQILEVVSIVIILHPIIELVHTTALVLLLLTVDWGEAAIHVASEVILLAPSQAMEFHNVIRNGFTIASTFAPP
jgi:hypothetical protein